MKIVVETTSGPRLFALSMEALESRAAGSSEATIGDLLDAVDPTGETFGASSAAGITVDEVVVQRSDLLRSIALHPGSYLAPTSQTNKRAHRPAVGSFEVVAGLEAGIRKPLSPGRYLIGRSANADVVLGSPTVSRHHARLEVGTDGSLAIADIGSRNGVRMGARESGATTCIATGGTSSLEWEEPVRLGATTVAARRSPVDAPHHLAAQRTHAGLGTLLTFNRIPRRVPPLPPAELELPTRQAAESYKPRFSWAAIVAPLILGAAMAVLWSPLYALFMLLSPALTVMNLWEDKHRARREKKQIEKRFRVDLARFDGELIGHLGAERQRRNDRHTDLAELRRRAATPSVHLWERRPQHDDFLRVVVGRGTLRLDLATKATHETSTEPEVEALLDRSGMLHDVPVEVALLGGSVTGVTGRRATSQAVARNLIGSIVGNHGPADVEIIVLCSPGEARAWEWVLLLPHVVDRHSSSNRPLVATTVSDVAELLERRGDGTAPGAVTSVVVVDGREFHEGRHAPVRLLAGRQDVALVVLAEGFDWLPSQTTLVIETAGDDGRGRCIDPTGRRGPIDIVLDGLAESTAWSLASALARFDDPELHAQGVGIPAVVPLGSLLGGPVDPATIRRRWSAGRLNSGLPAPIGADEHGAVLVDLVADGPHALIGGTTGSGKSELLRSMVASMAASADVDHLAFVLIDYKGGSAFDRCGDLPHTVGVVTDLDPHLSERALRCLNAELEYRERLLRRFEADSIEAYRALGDPTEPLPRLVVVIDEFATLVAELPDFVDALVGVAQRGRSLGVHLVLATQRPSGVISENIRTNTNLRVALRMLDSVDSVDVIGTDSAAHIGRDAPGRAHLRLGPGQLVEFQSALVTGSSSTNDEALARRVPFGGGESPVSGGGVANSDQTALDHLVATIEQAHQRCGLEHPRCPWPEPLTSDLTLGPLWQAQNRQAGNQDENQDEIQDEIVIGEIDDPDNQQQIPAVWTPEDGNSFVAGAAKSGVTSTLRTMIVAACASRGPDELHVFVLDLGRGEFADLEVLEHVGAVVGPSDAERQRRLLHLLAAEIRDRKVSSAAGRPTLLFILDGIDAFRRENDDRYDLIDLLDTIYLDGPAVGVVSLVSAASATALRHFASATRFRLYLRLVDPMDLREIGVRGAVDLEPPPGRGHLAPHGLLVQVARVDADALRAAGRHQPAQVGPLTVGTLTDHVPVDSLEVTAQLVDDRIRIPMGRRASDLAVETLSLEAGDHVLIAGPSRSGKTTTLLTIARQLVDVEHCDVCWLGESSPLDEVPLVQPADLALLAGRSTRTVVLIDDVEAISDSGELAELLASRASMVHLIAAGRVDRLRAAYGHWTNEFRQTRRGVLLWPDILDGDVLGVDLPSRSSTASIPGRGVLVDGDSCREVQLARE